jgi:hypothetical protein
MVERRHVTVWLLSAALVTLLVLFSAPAGALAQDGDGVTVDPNSPSGTEYDIPTERARRDAGGKKKSEKKSSDKAPLFGQGVGKEPTPTPTPTATSTSTATPTSTASSDAAKKKAKARAAARRKKAQEAKERKAKEAAAAASTPTPTPSPPPTANVERVSDTETGGGSSWMLIGGMLVALVIVGAGAGLALRRRFSN